MDLIRTASVPEAIIQRIIRMIGDGVWTAGDRLPSQRALAQELGVGMSSLREALQTLQGMGVVELRHGEGTFVCHTPSQIVERCLNLALVLDRDMVEDFLNARRAVEGGLAYLAAQRATDEQVAELARLVQRMREAIDAGDDAEYAQHDVAFHRLVAAMSGSDILQYLGSTLFDTLEEFVRVIPHTERGWHRHDAICKAIAARDPSRSEMAVHDLVEATAGSVLNFLESPPP
jgi:GntR family transcriptional repressor for pyruvate dehydrogenase complex